MLLLFLTACWSAPEEPVAPAPDLAAALDGVDDRIHVSAASYTGSAPHDAAVAAARSAAAVASSGRSRSMKEVASSRRAASSRAAPWPPAPPRR